MAKVKLTKEEKARVSEKIAKLIREGVDSKQAVAMAYDMARKHRLGKHGEYKRVKKV